MATSISAKCLRQASGRLPPVSAITAFSTCSCRCGRRLPGLTSYFTTSSRLGRRKNTYAPGLPQKQLRAMPIPEEMQSAEKYGQADQAVAEAPALEAWIRSECEGKGLLRATFEQVRQFIDRLPSLERTRTDNKIEFDESSLIRLCNETGLVVDSDESGANDVVTIATHLRNSQVKRRRYLARSLMFTLSSMGDVTATLIIMRNALQTHMIDNNALLKADIRNPRRTLQKIAAATEGGKLPTFPAKVLEGLILEELGDERGAIKMWKSALRPAVTWSKRADVAKLMKVASLGRDQGNFYFHTFEYLSPWIELANINLSRRDYDGAQAAAEAGAKADDPHSHYALSRLATTSEGKTSQWLRHITKAASSGHASAAFELAHFYGTQRWPFFVDEPDDDFKPTPFDTYPPENPAKQVSFKDRVMTAIGLKPMREGNVWELAVYPTTPQMRMQLAIEWLKASMALYHAPSYFLMAQFLLQEHLPGDLAVPPDAQALSPTRYKSASFDDYEGKASRKLESVPDVRNPLRNPDLAKKMIREVFYAAAAQSAWRRCLEVRARDGTGGSLERLLKRDKVEGLPEALMLPDQNEEEIRKWIRFPEVRASYSIDSDVASERRLCDHTLGINDLEYEAKRICEQEGWDIYKDDGTLIYRHGVSTPKPKAQRRY